MGSTLQHCVFFVCIFFFTRGCPEKGRKLPENTEIVPNFSAARSPAHMRKRPANFPGSWILLVFRKARYLFACDALPPEPSFLGEPCFSCDHDQSPRVKRIKQRYSNIFIASAVSSFTVPRLDSKFRLQRIGAQNT